MCKECYYLHVTFAYFTGTKYAFEVLANEVTWRKVKVKFQKAPNALYVDKM